MPKLLESVKSGFDLVPEGWHPVRVSEAKMVRTGPRSAAPGSPRISIIYHITTEGEYEGSTLFDGANLTGKGAGMGRQLLETLRPDIEWGDYDFPLPEDAAGCERLSDDLVEVEVYARVKHEPRFNNPSRLNASVAEIMPGDADMDGLLWTPGDEDDE